MNFQSDKKCESKPDLHLIEDIHNSSFTGDNGDQQIDNVSNALVTGGSRSQRAGTMTMRESAAAGKETSNQMRAKYDRSSLNSHSVRKVDRQVSEFDKKVSEKATITTSKKTLHYKETMFQNILSNNNLIINPTGSFSQIPITNLELDVGKYHSQNPTARMSMQNLRSSQNMRSSGSGFIAAAQIQTQTQEQQYGYLSTKNSERKLVNKKFLGSVQNQLAQDQQNQYLNLVTRVQSSNQRQKILNEDIISQIRCDRKDVVSDFDDMALSPFEKDDQNNMIKGRKIEYDLQQLEKKNWRNELPSHLKQQLPPPMSSIPKSLQNNQIQSAKFPKYKKSYQAAGNNDKKKPKRAPVKVNLNVDIPKNKKSAKELKLNAPQTAEHNFEGSANILRNPEQENQSLFMTTPKTIINQQVQSFPTQFAEYKQQIGIQSFNSRSKSPNKGKGLQAASSGVASTLIDKGDIMKHSYKKIEISTLNNDLQGTNAAVNGEDQDGFYSRKQSAPQKRPSTMRGSNQGQVDQQNVQLQNRPNLPTVQTRGPNTNSSLINLLQTAEENEDENTDGEVRVNSELYKQIPAISKQYDQKGLKNTQSVGELNRRRSIRKQSNNLLIQSAENGMSIGTLKIGLNNGGPVYEEYQVEKSMIKKQQLQDSSPGHSTSPHNSLGKNSSLRQSQDGIHQVDNCYAEPKLIIEEEEAANKIQKKPSQRYLQNKKAYGASYRLHDAKLNQCHLHVNKPCKCGAQTIFKQEFKISTSALSKNNANEGDEQRGSKENFAPADFKREAFKLDLHHLSDLRSIDEFEFQPDALASDQPISARSPRKTHNAKNSGRTGVSNSRQNSRLLSQQPKSSSPIVNKRVAIPTGFLKRSKANKVSNSRLEGGLSSSRNQDIQQILSTNEENQSSRIEPLKAARLSKSPFSDENKQKSAKKLSKRTSAPGSDKILLQQITDVENLGDKDVLKSFMDHLQRLSQQKKYENMKPIKMTEFDVQLQLPANLPDSSHASKYNFSPNRKQTSNLTNANSSVQKNLNLGANIAIMGPQYTKTFTQNLHSQSNGNSSQMISIPLNGMLSSGQKKVPKTRAKSSKQKKKAAKMASIEHDLANDIHSISLNEDLSQAFKASQTILNQLQEETTLDNHKEFERLQDQMKQIGLDLSTILEKHISNTMIITKNQHSQDQMAVQIEQHSLEMLLKTYQNIQTFHQLKQPIAEEEGEGEITRNIKINQTKSVVSKDSEEKGQITLVASSPRDENEFNQNHSGDLSPQLSPRPIRKFNYSNEYMQSSLGNLTQPVSPIGPSGKNAVQSMLLSTSPRDQKTVNQNDTSINLKILQDPTLRVQIVNNEKPTIDFNSIQKHKPSGVNFKFMDHLSPQTQNRKRGEVPISVPSTLHLQQKNKPVKKNQKIFRNKDLTVKQMPILQIISNGDPSSLNKDMINQLNNLQLLPQILPQYKYDLSSIRQQHQDQQVNIMRNKQFVTANLAQQKSKEGGESSGGNHTHIQDVYTESSRNIVAATKPNLTGQFQLQVVSDPTLEQNSLIGMGGPTHGTAQLQISQYGASKESHNPESSARMHVEIQENNMSDLGLEVNEFSQSQETNLVIVNQAEMFLPNDHILQTFDREDDHLASQTTFKLNHLD